MWQLLASQVANAQCTGAAGNCTLGTNAASLEGTGTAMTDNADAL